MTSAATAKEIGAVREKLRFFQDICDTYKDDEEDFTNSSISDFDIADAVSAIDSVSNNYYSKTDVVMNELNNEIPDFSRNDTLPQFCDKVDQANQVINTLTLCPTVGNFNYNPIYCDPGYWCGCSDPKRDGERCKPSNDTDNNFWAGHYTTTEFVIDPITNQSTPGKAIVYTGWASKFPDNYFKCSDTLHCPGREGGDGICPRLCNPGHYCPHPDTEFTCPVGSYCVQGSTEPTECIRLQRCNVEGMSFPKPDWYLIIVIVIAFVAFGFVVITYRFLNKLFPFQKKEEGGGEEEDAENIVNNSPDPVPGHANSTVITTLKSKRLVIHSIAAEEEEFKLLRQQSMVTTPKQSFTIDVQFNNLQLTLPNGICIMQGVTGELRGGQFTAIMGPSGAGKSTFLSLLSGKTEPTGGKLTVNGEESSLKDYRELVGFVPQEDIMLRELTVEENIRHSALMRLPTGLSHEEKMDRVYQVMESLDLLHIRNSIIGDEIVRGISGGQRKRVNVAMELVADPSLLALDEPTSGLDSTTSSKLCETLCQLALAGGVNVAAVIHQPKIEILEKFTNVLLLGVGGKTVYMGPTENMTDYFTGIGFPLPSQMNPADYYMDVIAGIIPCENNPNFKKEELFDLWNNSPENPGSNLEVDDGNNENDTVSQQMKGKAEKAFGNLKKGRQKKYRTTPGIVGQTCLLMKRAILQRCRVPRNTLIPIILSASAALLIGYYTLTLRVFYYGIPIVYTDRYNAASQFMKNHPLPPNTAIPQVWLFTALAIMLVCIISINTFGLEKAVFLRETFSGTNPTSYWFAKTLESGMWLPLYSAVYVAVTDIFKPLPIVVSSFWFVVWTSMIGFSGIGHIVSLSIPATNRGIVHLISCLVLIMVFSGGMIKYDGHQFFYLFFTYWTAQSYMKDSFIVYDHAFNTTLFNDNTSKYDLSYSFESNIVYAFLTGILWHFVALVIIIYRSR